MSLKGKLFLTDYNFFDIKTSNLETRGWLLPVKKSILAAQLSKMNSVLISCYSLPVCKKRERKTGKQEMLAFVSNWTQVLIQILG